MASGIDAGSLVEVRGQRWRLTRVQHFDACCVLSLEGRDRGNAMVRTQVIHPFDRPRRVSPASLQRRSRAVVVRRALAAIHHHNPVDGLWAAAAARIDLHAYQLEPALAAIRGSTRLLLADAVGLGKTIQAGLLLAELQQRGWIERALIVCPAGVREIWQRELRDRFSIDAAIVDQQSIADRVASFPPGINPWLADRVAIASIDFVKRAEVSAGLDAVPIDLLIADEAHHLSPGSDRGAAVASLAARSPWCVLVSATPHSGDRASFEYLTSIGKHGEDLTVFRRRRADVGLQHTRRVHFLAVCPTPAELALFRAIEHYSKAIWLARGRSDRAARLVAITLARRAASSIDAVTNTLRRRRVLVGTTPPELPQPLLPWDDVDEGDADEPDSLIAAAGLESVAEERAELDSLVDLAATCTARSKMHRLLRLLRRIAEPAIVFTEYRDTLDSVVTLLKNVKLRVMSIHGAMPREARRAAVDAINAGTCDVLIATDAAGEGLNLHHRCRLIIDLELPWNPLRLEQRVGRVDRIGQRRVVHAIRLFHRGTIEEAVLDRLALRRRRAEDDLGRAVAERDVAAAVFSGMDLQHADNRAVTGASIAAAESECHRVASQRRSPASTVESERCASWPKHAGSRRMFVIHRETYANEHGTIAGNRIGAHLVTFDRLPQCSQQWRAVIDGIAGRIDARPPGAVIGGDGIRRRVKAIRQQLAARQRREYQRSLFDERADTVQTRRERIAKVLDDALARVARALEPPDRAHTRIEIVAAWPERRR